VIKAQEIAADPPVRRIDPAPFFGWLDAVLIDEDHVAPADVDRPLIAVTIRERDDAVMISDGWNGVIPRRSLYPGVVVPSETLLPETREMWRPVWRRREEQESQS
jgi:hypothetical protein